MKTVLTTPEFEKWLADLSDPVAAGAISDRMQRMQRGLLGMVAPVGDGVSEAKVDVGQGYRVYFVQHGKDLVVLLCGGDKSSQKKDIKRAKKIASELEW